jgi:YebC/PmpR family DNA-binding regulatory protein
MEKITMAGHSKWANIKRKKQAEDAKRAKIFTRLSREITVAARQGGGDPDMNPSLSLAVEKAKEANMPNDNIERAIKRGTGELEGGEVEEYTYEGYGVEGVAFMIEVLTDNKNRAIADVKHALNKYGGNMAQNGAVSWQFDQKGYMTIKNEDEDGEPIELDFEEVFMVAAEAGAEDVTEDDDDLIEVYTPRDNFGQVEQGLRDAGYKTDDAELRWFPKGDMQLNVDTSIGVQNLRIMEMLEDLDDVQSVSTNMILTDEIRESYESD